MGLIIFGGIILARFCSLYSSSSGNSTYLGMAENGILVDVGVSYKKLKEACDFQGIDLESVRGVFITHEHSDHVKGLRTFLSKHNVPVFSSASTLECLLSKDCIPAGCKCVPVDGEDEICTIGVKCFHTSHDTPESMGYKFFLPDERQISVCTDLGVMSDEVFEGIKKSDLVLLESNHDIDMLRCGPYPLELKKRILSDRGHLSNNACAETSVKLLSTGTTRFVLGHLSHENNTPDKAYAETFTHLDMAGARINIDYTLTVAGDKNKMIRL